MKKILIALLSLNILIAYAHLDLVEVNAEHMCQEKQHEIDREVERTIEKEYGNSPRDENGDRIN